MTIRRTIDQKNKQKIKRNRINPIQGEKQKPREYDNISIDGKHVIRLTIYDQNHN